MRQWYWIPALVLGSALAGCAEGTKTSTPQFQGDYQGTLFNYAAGGRDLHTVVVGDPFGEAEAFAPRVAAILTERSTREPSNFTTDPGPSAHLQYKVVLFFDPERSVTPNTLCGDAGALQPKPPGDLQSVDMLMAFCDGVLAVSYLRGSYNDGGREGRFESFLALMLHLLLPTETPRRFR